MRLKLAAFLCLVLSPMARAQNGGKGVVKAAIDPQSFVNEKKLALVIGINDYPEESGLSKLKWAVKDASDLADELRKQGYTVDPLLNERVTKTAIRRHLTDMLKRLDPNAGTVVFAFSGHGGQVGKEQYLATYESSTDDLDKSGASVAEIRTLLEDSGAPRKMMFLDACRNVTAPGAKDITAPADPMTELSTSRGLRLLVSTAPKTRSYEYDDIQHGVFTYYIIEGLKGAAARADGLVTFGNLAGYVTRKVKDRNPSQVPYTDGQSTGEFALAGNYKAPVSSAVIGMDYQAVKDTQDPMVLDTVASGMEHLAADLRLRADALRSRLGTPSVIPRTGTLASLRQYADELDAQKRYSEALPLYRQLAAANDPWGQYRYGRYHQGDRGIPADHAVEVAMYSRSADGGESYGMNGLGSCYALGWSVALDFTQALSWYRKAVELGNPRAMYNLGVMYRDGKGIASDDAQAVSWFRKGAELGDSLAMISLGYMYFNGFGTEKDQAQANSWYRKAAEAGSSDAMFNLGIDYEKGGGVPKNLNLAVEWFRKAAAAGDEDAQDALKRLAKEP